MRRSALTFGWVVWCTMAGLHPLLARTPAAGAVAQAGAADYVGSEVVGAFWNPTCRGGVYISLH